MANYDAIIIGAGVVGCSIAHALARNGFKTLNVDSLPAAGYGSTSHSSAIIRPLYSDIEAACVAHESRSRWLKWGEFVGDQDALAQYNEAGLTILLFEGDDNAFHANITSMKEAGVNAVRLSKEETLKKYPKIIDTGFAPPKPIDDPTFGEPNGRDLIGALHVAEAGFVNDPQLAAKNLSEAAKKLGAVFKFNAKVSEIFTTDNTVTGVELESGETISAPIIINAAGPHSGIINEMANIRPALPIKTRALRHEVAYIPAPEGMTKADGMNPLMDMDTGIYVKPDGNDLVLGTLDPPCDGEDEVDPDDYNTEITGQWTTQAWRGGLRIPSLEIPNTARGFAALYDVSDDWCPIYDKTDLGGFYLAIGTSGNQFKNAPMIGDIMATIIMAESQGIDHDVDPCSLTLTAIGKTVDLSYYSRNREIRETNTVLA
jgi:sarcosine oxidase subunit beta